MKGWKVIRKDRTSAIHSMYSITYPVGEEVKPTLKGSKLFFFAKKRDASFFAHINCLAWLIVPCIAKGVSKPKWISASPAYTGDVIKFWKLRSKSDWNLTTAPQGTRFADSITCLE